MSRRLDYDYVYNYFKSNGCRLLEDEYINNTTVMRFICSCGKKGKKHWAGFRLHPSCSICSRKNSDKGAGSFSYEYVLNFVNENSGCILISREYHRNSDNMQFICSCGHEFETTFAKFKDRGKRQCNSCSYGSTARSLAHTYEYVRSFIEVESGSGCILISKDYTRNSEPLDIKCECGEMFRTSFQKFTDPDRKRRHCDSCSSLLKSESAKLSYEEVKGVVESRECKLVSNDYVDAKTKISIACACGEEYDVSYDAFRRGQDRCSICSGKISKLELTVKDYLIDNEVNFKTEFKFEDCRNIEPLPFDFAVMRENNEIDFLIEVDGQQHFYPIEFFGGEEGFEAQQARDKIKNEFCLNNDITLVRIPYYDIDDIDSYLIDLI